MKCSDTLEFEKRTNVSRETLSALDVYAELLRKWNKVINLVSPSTLDELWTRHFLDSAQLLQLVEPKGTWVDLGSGGGFPGLVLAILTRNTPDLKFVLVEADQRKMTFLKAVVRTLGLETRVLAGRIEEIEPLEADIVSARALAPLSILLEFSERHMKLSGTALFPKGEKADAEIAEALESWSFDCEKHRSLTDASAAILRIGEIKRV